MVWRGTPPGFWHSTTAPSPCSGFGRAALEELATARVLDLPLVKSGYHPLVRIVTIFLLCLGLIFQSQAGAVSPQQPCPMEAQAAWGMVDGMGDGCCNDEATALATGMLCKTDMPCASTSLGIWPTAGVSVPVLPDGSPTPAVLVQHGAQTPSAVWRPPSFS